MTTVFCIYPEFPKTSRVGKSRTREIDNTPKYYLPDHFIMKIDKRRTKLSAVFDARVKNTSILSLDDC